MSRGLLASFHASIPFHSLTEFPLFKGPNLVMSMKKTGARWRHIHKEAVLYVFIQYQTLG